MGCDGGTIPKRDELVRTQKKPEQVQREIENAVKWKSCTISQQALHRPIVACELGRLYNKESILECLLNKSFPENCQHIKSLKDVKTLNLTENPAYVEVADKGDAAKDFNISPWICPVVGLEMNGNYRFCVIWKCGCVLSEKAVREVKSETCHKCGETYDPSRDTVLLNPDSEDLEQQRLSMERRRAEAKQRKKTLTKIATEAASADIPSTSTNSEHKPEIADGTTSSATVTEQTRKQKLNEKEKKPTATAALSANNKSLNSAAPPAKKVKSVQDDPRASKVFKSLFTSSEEEQKQPRAHWVTYNPFYN